LDVKLFWKWKWRERGDVYRVGFERVWDVMGVEGKRRRGGGMGMGLKRKRYLKNSRGMGGNGNWNWNWLGREWKGGIEREVVRMDLNKSRDLTIENLTSRNQPNEFQNRFAPSKDRLTHIW